MSARKGAMAADMELFVGDRFSGRYSPVRQIQRQRGQNELTENTLWRGIRTYWIRASKRMTRPICEIFHKRVFFVSIDPRFTRECMSTRVGLPPCRASSPRATVARARVPPHRAR